MNDPHWSCVTSFMCKLLGAITPLDKQSDIWLSHELSNYEQVWQGVNTPLLQAESNVSHARVRQQLLLPFSYAKAGIWYFHSIYKESGIPSPSVLVGGGHCTPFLMWTSTFVIKGCKLIDWLFIRNPYSPRIGLDKLRRHSQTLTAMIEYPKGNPIPTWGNTQRVIPYLPGAEHRVS